MEPKAQMAERLLRGLGVAVKTFALYPLPHPVTAGTIDNLTAAARRYTEAFGPFSARVSRHALTVDGVRFREGPHASLALYFFTRKIAQIKILPGVSEAALSAFVAAVGRDRASLEAEGGVRHLLRQAGVGNVQVVELAVGQEAEDPEPLDLSSIFEMLGRDRASPHERERVIEILRGGPEQALVLLESVYALAGGSPEDALEDDQVEQVYQAVRHIDRLILDEPFEDQPRLYASLAGAQLAIHEPLRSALMQRLVRREGAGAIRLLGGHLSAEQLADLVARSVSGDDLTHQVATFLQALCADRQKARAVLSLLDTRLRLPGQAPNWLTEAVWPRLQSPSRREPEISWEFVLGNGEAPPEGAAGSEVWDSRTADDAEVMRELALTLVDLLRHESDERDRRAIEDIGDTLAGSLRWFVDEQDYATLRRVLDGIRRIETSEGGVRRAAASGVLKNTAEGPVVEALLAALWANRGTLAEGEIRGCLEALSDHLVQPLIHALAREERGGLRAMLCDLIAELYGDRIEDLAAFASDSRWYLVRNIVSILGRVRNPQAVVHLQRLIAHPDYRVRREVLNALEAIGTPEAHAALGAFLDDPDERLRLRAIESMDTWEAWHAMPRLLAILEQRGPFVRHLPMKLAALDTLARLGARQSLPTVRRIASTWYLWGKAGRQLRQAAAQTAAIIEGRGVPPKRRPMLDDEVDRW
jgi:HEAT repeat protein